MKKNIIFITMLPIWSMNNGCGGRALYNTITGYLNNNYNVFLITNQKNDYSKIEKIKKENIFYINTEWYEKNNTKNKIFVYKYFREFEKKCYKQICKILKKIKNEKVVLYAYEVNAVRPAKKASVKYKIRLVTRFQGTIMSKYKNNLYYKIRKYPHIQALSTRADLVIMTDDGTQGDKVLDNYKNNSNRMFIRNGVNILDCSIDEIDKAKMKKVLNIDDNKTILLTVSRLVDWKRVDRAILALNELKNKENYCLIIVGEGPEKTNLKKLVENLKLSENVKFLGAIKNEDVKLYMQLSDIFLSFYDLSNVGNPLLEALCLGKPIITYNVGDTNKIINGNNGIILDDVSAINIAKNIEQINNKKKLEQYSKNAKEYANMELYSWKDRINMEIIEVDKLFSQI